MTAVFPMHTFTGQYHEKTSRRLGTYLLRMSYVVNTSLRKYILGSWVVIGKGRGWRGRKHPIPNSKSETPWWW